MSLQSPYAISGTVTVDGSVYQGAKLWLKDMTEGTNPAPVDGSTLVYSNDSGQYLIDLADSTTAYANGDSVTIYCKVGNIISHSTITISLIEGSATVNFTITRKSGLTDGLKSTKITAGTGGLRPSGMIKGCIDSMN